MMKKVLLVEDEPLFVMKFKVALNILGFSCVLESASNANDAIDLYKTMLPDNKPDIIFVDLNLNDSNGNGIDIIHTIINELGNNVIAGIISSSNNSEELLKIREVGASFYISKRGSAFKTNMKKLHNHFFVMGNTGYVEIK